MHVRGSPSLSLALISIFGTFWAVYIYSQFSVLADSENYISGYYSEAYGEGVFDRTVLVDLVASGLAAIIGGFGAHLTFSLLCGLAMVPLFKVLTGVRRMWAYVAILLPSFLAWHSIVGKEAFAVAGGALLLFCWARMLAGRVGPAGAWAFLIGGGLLVFIRPHYAVGALWLIVATYLLDDRSGRGRMKGALARLPLSGLYGLLVIGVIALYPLLSPAFERIIWQGLGFFLPGDGQISRFSFLIWQSPTDYWANLWWGFPFSIIGPLPHELLVKPKLMVLFVEGLCVVGFICHAVGLGIFARTNCDLSHRRFMRKVLWFALIPGICFMIMVHTPFGMAHPADATRYRAGIHVFLTLAPLVYWQYLPLVARFRRRSRHASLQRLSDPEGTSST